MLENGMWVTRDGDRYTDTELDSLCGSGFLAERHDGTLVVLRELRDDPETAAEVSWVEMA